MTADGQERTAPADVTQTIEYRTAKEWHAILRERG